MVSAAALNLEAAAPFAVWRRLSLIFILAAVLCCAVQESFASDGYMGASMDELLGEAVEPKPDKVKAKAKAPAAAAFVSAKASAPAAAPAPVPPSSGRNSTSSEGSADGSVGVTCPKTRHVRHCISGRILYLTTISYEGDSCARKKKVKRTRADRNCPIGTKYSRTKCSRSGYRIETSLTVYLDDCVCKRRKLSTKKRCTPECKPATQRTRCIDNSLYRIESGEKVVNFACTAYTKQVALKPDCTVGVRKKPGTCRGLFMTVTELRTTYRNCRCRTTRKRVRVRCACPKTKVRTRCDGNVKMRISTVYRLKRNSCKVETKVKRIPISCPKNRVKSRSSCRADCSQTVTETWAEVRNCRCVRPVKKRTVKCCCPKPQRNSYCRGSVLHSMVRRFQLRGGRCKEKVKVTKKPIVCNKKYRPVKSSCAFNGYRRVILYNQERRGCECVKRRRITYEKCGCGKDYTTEKCDDNVWIVKAVTHKMDGAKSACKRSVAVRKKPIKCRGKLHRRVSRCQSDGYRVVRQLVEEARDCVCVTRVTSHRERCRCEKSRIEHECRGNRVYKHRYVQHLVDGRCLLKRTTSVVRIKCGENTVKSSDCVKGWRTKTYVNYYPYNCKCLKRVYNRQVRCACPKNRTKTRCIRGVLVKLEKKYEMKDGQCIGHSCKITRRVHCPRKFEVKRGKCTKKQRIVTTRETRRRNCKCKSVVKRTKEVCGCPRPVHRRVCSADQVETIYSTKYKLVDGLCLAEEDEKVIPNKCPSKPLYRRGRCGSDGSRVDTWVHHSLRKCVCHQRVKRLRLRCRCPKPTKRRKCVKHRSLEIVKVSHLLIRGVCKRSVSFQRTPVYCLEEETPIYGRCRGARKGRSAGQRLITFVKHQTRNCRCVKRTRVKKIPCACHLLNYRTKRCENKKKRFVIRDYRFTEGAERCKKTVKTTNVPIKCDENRSEHKSACGKRGYQTVTLTYHKLVSCACVKKHKKRRVICRCPKTKVELKPDPKLKWNRKCTTVYRLNREKNRCDKKTKCPAETKQKKMCRPVMAPLKAGPCNKETGFQTTELTIGRVVLLPPPQNRYACLVKKVKMKRRCACPKPARTVKCRRNVLITVTVTQKLKGQKCIKAKKVDKKATKCPKNSISETKCRSDNTKVVTKVTYRKRNCKCERKVKHRRVLCRCPDPIISTQCVRHTIKERSTVSYQLKSERCRRKKQVSKKKIKCKGGTKVTRTKCDKRCNQKVTKVTRYIRNCECRKKTDISSVKCCCPKSVTRVACIDDSRRVVTTTSWRLVRGACQRKARKREKKIVCLSNLKPIRGPCKRNGYRQVTFVSYRLRKCKCVRVQRKSNELCRCPKSHSESSCRSERLVTRRTRYRLQDTGRGKKVCTRHVRNLVRSPGCPVDKRVKTTKCREDDFKRITTVRRYQKNCKCRKSVKTEKQRCRCPKSSKKVSCHSDNVIKVLRTTYTLRGNSCLKDEQTKATKVVCYEKEKPDRSPCGEDGYRQVKLVSYQARDCKCTRRVRVLRERCSCPKDYRARECINNNVVSTFVTYTLTSKECIRRSKITKEKPKCKSISKKSKGACRSDGFQSVFYEHEKLVNCECQKQVQTRKIRCACPKTRVKRRCVDNKIVTTKTSFKLSGNRCHRSRSHHRSRVSCPAKKRVVKHKCVGNKRIYEYLEHRLRNCACKLVRQRVVKPCRCPKPKTIEKPCVAGKQKVVTIYYVKDRMGNCKKMTDVDTEVCARRKTCRCDALGDPHFLMYDGVPLHFQGECKYTLTKLRNPADPCAFDVQVKNEHRGDNKNYTYVRLLDVKIFGRVFRLHQHKRLLVDGKIVSLPYTGPGFRVFYSGPYVQFVATKCRFSAAFDGRYTGYVEVGKQYAGRMVGLCGNCNGKQKDDYVTREGVNVIAKKDNFERDNLVGNSFRVPDDSDKPGKRCKNTPALSASSACSNAWIPRARALCRRLSDRRGPFGKCIASGRVPSLALANDCRNDACVNRLKPAALRRAVCEAHKDLAEQCAEAGFAGLRWRTKTFCPMKCDKDKVYTTKMQPCPKSCENLFFGTKANCYNLPKREGCACKKGLVLDGRKCVRPEMCQCVKKFPELMCKDDASAKKCRRWRAAGHCASNPYTMLKMCRRTCGLCHTKKAKASCRNIMSVRRCKILKRKGQCGTSFVSTACRRTCGLCKAGDKIVEEKSTNKTAKSSRRGHTVVLRSTEDKD